MDGVSWSTTRAQESFSRTRTTTDTLSKLATFIARADPKQQGRNQRQQSSHLSTYDCQECVQGSQYTTDLHQELKHTLPKPHWCPSCGQEFSLRSSLQLHKCDHESSLCELCHGKSRHGSPCPACMSRASGQCRTQEKSLHLLDTSPYACAPCGKGFTQKQALLHHQQAGCSEPPSLLDIADACGFADDSPPVSEADSTRSDSSDIPGCSTETFNTCQLCSRSFRTEAALQRHKQTNHAADWPISSKGQKSRGEDTSRDARKGVYSKVNGEPVKGTKSKSKLLSCRSCELVFSSTSKLYRHRKEKHSRDTKMRRESRPVIVKHRRRGTYSCELCAKVFFHHLSLRAHYRQHTTLSFAAVKHNSQSIECITKDSTMSENRPNKLKSSLANNNTLRAGPGRPKKEARSDRISDPGRGDLPEVEEEEGEREFPCPSCAEVFSLQSQLREHVELHQSSVKRRTCSVCTCDMDTCKWPGSKRQRLYHCVPCQQGFSALDSFLEHCQEHLRVRVEEDCITEGYTHPAGKA